MIRLARTHGADAIDLAQAVRLCLDHIEYPFAKHPNQLLGIDRADAADHAGAKVFLDTVDRCWS